MRRFSVCLALVGLAAAAPASGGQDVRVSDPDLRGDAGIPLEAPDGVRVFTGAGEEASWEAMVVAARAVDVVLLGEIHDDSVGHAARHRLVEVLARGEQELVLSLEMFESDVQPVLDEYLAGLITEDHFLAASRPWARYATDYRPYVELARERDFPVVAANPPRRYVNRVYRLGAEGLVDLPPEAARWLPPLPLGPPSDRYRAEWDAAAEEHGHGGEEALLAQVLWDAGMAHAIARGLLERPDARVIHVAGAFHVAGGTGIPEHLERYRPGTSRLIVAAYPVSADQGFDPDSHLGRGDFVLLTHRAVPAHPSAF